MQEFKPWNTDLPLDMDEELFHKCFKNTTALFYEPLSIEYWDVEMNGKHFFVYKWTDNKLYLNDSGDNADNDVIQSNIHKCSADNLTETLNRLQFSRPGESETSNADKVRFENVLKEIKNNTTYFINEFGDKKHEDAIENILRKEGFVKHKNNETAFQPYYYVKEPNGPQNPPDFRIFANSETLDLECKSCKKGFKPMWNASYPSEDVVYVYTNPQKTLIFSGDEIVTTEVKEILDDYKRLNRQLHDEINQRLQVLPQEKNPYRMQVYPRNMFIQTKHLDPEQHNKYSENVLQKLQLKK